MDTTEKLANAFLALMVLFIACILVSVPFTEWNSAGVVQKQLNTQCGTNYSQLDVLLSGEKLTELCKIKSQELLIKQE
jgi:hypothetical protein